jgi:endonuclease I
MNLFKYLILNNLYFNINTLIKNSINLEILKKNIYKKPITYHSVKKTKGFMYDNNFYDDIYADSYNINLHKNNNNKKKNLILTAEHIFPQSYSKVYKKSIKDMHNIYLTTSENNYHRSNYKFAEIDNLYIYNITIENLIHISYDNYKYTKYNLFFPCNNSKGKISRSIAYMKYMYPKINLSKVIDYNTMIEWNYLFPPTKYEIIRNKKIYKIQGNTNPFILNYRLMNHYL